MSSFHKIKWAHFILKNELTLRKHPFTSLKPRMNSGLVPPTFVSDVSLMDDIPKLLFRIPIIPSAQYQNFLIQRKDTMKIMTYPLIMYQHN